MSRDLNEVCIGAQGDDGEQTGQDREQDEGARAEGRQEEIVWDPVDFCEDLGFVLSDTGGVGGFWAE